MIGGFYRSHHLTKGIIIKIYWLTKLNDLGVIKSQNANEINIRVRIINGITF